MNAEYIRRETNTEPLTLEEIRDLASHWCPDCYQDFQISMEEDRLFFSVCGWEHLETIDALCTLHTLPMRLAMELNLGTLFDNMQDIWERERGISHG